MTLFSVWSTLAIDTLYRRVFRRSEADRTSFCGFPFIQQKVKKRERGCLIKLLSSIPRGPAFTHGVSGTRVSDFIRRI